MPQRIFVQIVSYRDPECHHTITDLFEKAASPERISVGLCWQYDPEEDKEFLSVPYPRSDQVQVVEYHVKDAQGAGWARNEAQKFWRGEEYILQIQAHHRFEKGWDDTLIALLEALPTRKAILTAWLPGYEPPDEIEPLVNSLPTACVNRLGAADDPQMVHMVRRDQPANDRRAPFLTGMWVGNFMFTHAATLQEVPFDPHIYFWGEEINYSARLWTSGYDIYHLHRPVLYHYWDRKDVRGDSYYRDQQEARNQISLARNLRLFGFEGSGPEAALIDIENYALGPERSIDDYFKFLGINWQQGEISVDAKLGRFGRAAGRPRIFVSMAAHRDPEANATIRDLFARAAFPDRIFMGICQQLIPVEDDAHRIRAERPAQIRITDIDARQSQGANWARATAMSLHQDEEYILQIDSHMRFVPAWDELLLSMLERTPDPRHSAISAYLPNYDPPDKLNQIDQLLCMRVRRMGDPEDAQLIHLTARFTRYRPGADLYQTPFAIMNFMFAPAAVWRTVPIDPHFTFYGDEISISARLFTHGVNIYQPNERVAYHYWHRADELHKQHYRRTRTPQEQRSLARVKHLLGIETSTDAEATTELARYGLGSARPLLQLWEYAGVDPVRGYVSTGAYQGVWNEAALKPGYTPPVKPVEKPGQPKIFVRIASYRDPECQYTVKDLFEKATYPDRINIGICWQYDEREDVECFQVVTRPEQVRIIMVDWKKAEGVCWARSQTEKLWKGEEYTLQIDSHMRFVPGWDELMIEELARCPADKPVISCSPARYIPPNDLDKRMNATVRRVRPFTSTGNIRGHGEMLETNPPHPLRGAFIAAGYVFSRSDIIREVPYDPYLFFDQEEIMYALRLFTCGWDVFSASRQYLYHYYNDGNTGRNIHWSDLKKHEEERLRSYNDRALARMNHITGHKRSQDPAVLENIVLYDVGDVRSIGDFKQFCGVDLAAKTTQPKAHNATFIPGLRFYRRTPIGEPARPEAAAPAVKPPQVPAHPSAIADASPRVREPFGVGDLFPYLVLAQHDGKSRSLDVVATMPHLFFVLPFSNGDQNAEFIRQVQSSLRGRKDHYSTYVINATVQQLAEFQKRHGLNVSLCSDADHAIGKVLGATAPCCYVLGKQLQVFEVVKDVPLGELATRAVKGLDRYIAQRNARRDEGYVTETSPALIVPDIFPPEFCQQLIDAFEHGHNFQGAVGEEGYKPNSKIRRDHIVTDAIRSKIDLKLSRTVFQQIERVYGFTVTSRENYKIGLYSGEDEGFFAMHRDNYDEYLGYRRIAMTVNLSDGFEGGGLRFPEYDERIYRPTKGSAIIFPASCMHEALKVTKGLRYVLVGFFHGEEEEGFRRDMRKRKEQSDQIREFTPTLQDLSGVKLARDFFRNWKKRRS